MGTFSPHNPRKTRKCARTHTYTTHTHSGVCCVCAWVCSLRKGGQTSIVADMNHLNDLQVKWVVSYDVHVIFPNKWEFFIFKVTVKANTSTVLKSGWLHVSLLSFICEHLLSSCDHGKGSTLEEHPDGLSMYSAIMLSSICGRWQNSECKPFHIS